jgi:hypothetical protein
MRSNGQSGRICRRRLRIFLHREVSREARPWISSRQIWTSGCFLAGSEWWPNSTDTINSANPTYPVNSADSAYPSHTTDSSVPQLGLVISRMGCIPRRAMISRSFRDSLILVAMSNV